MIHPTMSFGRVSAASDKCALTVSWITDYSLIIIDSELIRAPVRNSLLSEWIGLQITGFPPWSSLQRRTAWTYVTRPRFDAHHRKSDRTVWGGLIALGVNDPIALYVLSIINIIPRHFRCESSFRHRASLEIFGIRQQSQKSCNILNLLFIAQHQS